MGSAPSGLGRPVVRDGAAGAGAGAAGLAVPRPRRPCWGRCRAWKPRPRPGRRSSGRSLGHDPIGLIGGLSINQPSGRRKSAHSGVKSADTIRSPDRSIRRFGAGPLLWKRKPNPRFRLLRSPSACPSSGRLRLQLMPPVGPDRPRRRKILAARCASTEDHGRGSTPGPPIPSEDRTGGRRPRVTRKPHLPQGRPTMKPYLALMLAVVALPAPSRGQEVLRDIPYARENHPTPGALSTSTRRRPRTCPSSSGFTAAAGRPATSRASRSSRRRSWTRGSSSSPPTTGSCRTSTWGPSCATSPSRSAGCTTTSPSTAATRSASSSWAIPPVRSSPR